MVWMIRWRLLSGLLLLALALTPLAAMGAPPGNGNANAERQSIIAVFHDSVTDSRGAAEDIAQRHNAELRFVYSHALKGFAAEVPARAVAAINRDARVAFVELDQEVSTFNDVPTGVDRIEADENPTANINGTDQRVDVDIAILDTGIDHNHPALNVVGGANCTGGSPVFASCSNVLPGDGHGHGTHVAGTAAGIDGTGLVGVAPGASLWAVKVLNDNGSGRMSQIIAGIDWVTARADTIEVANMSLGCECTSAGLDTALNNSTGAGVVYVVAAGNSAKDASTFSPANHSRVITVSAMADFDGMAGGAADPTCRSDVGGDDEFATFSNFGSAVNIAAPGVCIKSAVPGGGYAEWSGTSMASPHGAGAAALYIVEKNVGLSSNRWQIVRDGIIASWTVPQDDECGFTGGKSNEPFLLLEDCVIAPGGGDNGGDDVDTGTITGSVTDSDTGDGIAGATITIEGTGLSTTTNSSGSYTIEDVEAGTYSVTAAADDYQSHTETGVEIPADGSVTVDFSLTAQAPPDAGTVSVTNIDYSTHGGRNNDRHLSVTVTVRDGDNNAVPNASVQGTLQLSGSTTWNLSGTTGSNGTVTFSLNNAPSGTYTTTITNVTANGLEWDGQTPENEFEK